MSFHYSPKIITQGLISYMDAANPKSYISGDTTWYDLTTNKNNGTLESGPTFDSDNGGSILFNGTTQYINLGNSNDFTFGNGITDSPFSICAWVKMVDATNFTIISKYTTTNEEWAFVTTGVDKVRVVLYDDSLGPNVNIGRQWDTPVTPYVGQWAYVVVTYNGSGLSGLKIYWDTVRVDDTDISNGTYVAMENTNSDVNIARFTGAVTEHANGNISNLSIYNIELTPNNIVQNYNALKSRFQS